MCPESSEEKENLRFLNSKWPNENSRCPRKALNFPGCAGRESGRRERMCAQKKLLLFSKSWPPPLVLAGPLLSLKTPPPQLPPKGTKQFTVEKLRKCPKVLFCQIPYQVHWPCVAPAGGGGDSCDEEEGEERRDKDKLKMTHKYISFLN